MTRKEAIEYLKLQDSLLKSEGKTKKSEARAALSYAINSLQIDEELLGDEPEKAEGRDEPKPVNYDMSFLSLTFQAAYCPVCEKCFEEDDENWLYARYCPYCGQALKWEE